MVRKGKKVITAILLAAVTLSSAISVPVMADTSRTEKFYVYINGGSQVSSGSAKKAKSGTMYTYTRAIAGSNVTWVQGVETVNLRGRTQDGKTGVTSLGETSYQGPIYLTYKYGYGTVGAYYRLAVQYASDNPYEKLELQCTWRP